MALPRRIVNPDPATGLFGRPGSFIRHAGQRFTLNERALDCKLGWVWICELPDSPGAQPSLLLYDGPNTDAKIIGRAEPTVRWPGQAKSSEAEEV